MPRHLPLVTVRRPQWLVCVGGSKIFFFFSLQMNRLCKNSFITSEPRHNCRKKWIYRPLFGCSGAVRWDALLVIRKSETAWRVQPPPSLPALLSSWCMVGCLLPWLKVHRHGEPSGQGQHLRCGKRQEGIFSGHSRKIYPEHSLRKEP